MEKSLEPSAAEPIDRNRHVKDYLAFYAEFRHPPRYALLLNGPWGIGKTFLVKKFMEPLASRGYRYAYVSLYGLSSVDEIDDALFRSLYPIIDNKGARFAGRFVKSIGKSIGFDLDLKAADVLNKTNSDLFIFDDLERCDMPINRVLGYINEFVEHEGRKVVIIANEMEIQENNEYRRIREKLVGKTLEIRSALEEALDVFISSLENVKTKDFLNSKISVIKEIYNQSQLDNLRVLQQFIWDFERFYTSLSDNHQKNDVAITVLLRLQFALAFELKEGRIAPKDIFERNNRLVLMLRSQREGEDPAPIETVRIRYPEVDLGSTALSSETIVNLLTKGIVDTVQIHTELNASSFFVTVSDEPAWRTVWHAFERTEDEFNSALKEMERAFSKREYYITGEILHIFGIRLWLSKIGALSKGLEIIVSEAKTYVDDLYAQGRVEPLDADAGYQEMLFEDFGGLGIHENSTEEYRALYHYLSQKRRAAAADRYPKIAEDLLGSLRNSPDSFIQRIAYPRDQNKNLSYVPVLASIDPGEFASIFENLHPSHQRSVLIALKARYDHDKLKRDLKDEHGWAVELRRHLLHSAESASPIARYRVVQNIKYYLDEVVGPEEIGDSEHVENGGLIHRVDA